MEKSGHGQFINIETRESGSSLTAAALPNQPGHVTMRSNGVE
jgi:hypothetical protein